MGAVPQIAADLPQRPSRQPWATSRLGCMAALYGKETTDKFEAREHEANRDSIETQNNDPWLALIIHLC